MSSVSDYICFRCKYKTTRKSSMQDHLYNKKKICPSKSLDTDIELTEEIKEKILSNRVYHPPSKKFVKPKIISNTNEMHYIYLIRSQEHVDQNVNVYKIGRTVVKEGNSKISRFDSYGKGSQPLMLIECIDSLYCEKEILNLFRQKFDKYKFGTEYFIGNSKEMKEIIFHFINSEKSEK